LVVAALLMALSPTWGEKIPAHYVVDRRGRRIAYWAGEKNWLEEGDRRLIEFLLAEEPVATAEEKDQ
jgi:hypothetical protein